MPSIASLILRSAQRACLEGRTVPLQPMLQGCRALEAYHWPIRAWFSSARPTSVNSFIGNERIGAPDGSRSVLWYPRRDIQEP